MRHTKRVFKHGIIFVRSIGGVFTHSEILRIRNSVDKSTVLRTRESEVRILPDAPVMADVA